MLQQYFSDDAIIDYLCRERVKLAGSVHDRQYITRLAGHQREAAPNHRFYQLLPPRRQWNDFRVPLRSSHTNPDLIALKQAVRVLRRQVPQQPWLVEMNRYITAIRERMFGCHPFVFASPDIQWQPKKEHSTEYRALCKFPPDDNLILSLFARYLRDVFDAGFSNASYAFRSRRQGRMPTHHQAFDEIYQLKSSAPTKDLYVAECDIKGFFDAVDHGVAITAFWQAAEGKDLHHRTEAILQAYLDCYSFPLNVLAEAGPRLNQSDPKGYFKWPEDALMKHHSNPRNQRIGVPQGGAVSGVIANLVLDAADKAVERERHKLGGEIHYYRYCDDMVLLSPNKRHCKSVFNAYLQALDNLKLPYHEPQTTIIYGPKHWENKSKAPYLWSGRKWFGCVPWIQFVGYQIRYDGLVRPRKDSIKKQATKLDKTVGKLTHGLLHTEQPILASRNQARSSLKSKLVAQGVGRIKGWESGPRPMCWASGFKGLHEKAFVPGSLRYLDQVRSKQIHKFDGVPIQYGDGKPGNKVRRREPVGYAFSYEAQFTNLGGQSLIHNPWRPNSRQMFQTWLFVMCQKWVRWLETTWAKISTLKFRLK